MVDSTVSGNHFLNILSLIIIFILVLAMAYYATKFVAKYQGNIINSKSNIKVIESARIGTNKMLAIVKIGDCFYAVGIGKDEITVIDKIDEKSLDLTLYAKNENTGSFSDVLSRIKKNTLDDNKKK